MKKDLVIVLAPDSFKESMTAKEVCEAMERGIRKANSQIRCIHVPMADGGEGTMQSLVDATGGRVYSKEVVGPLGNNVVAEYGILGNGEIGVIEMASASGIHLVDSEKRNPLITTTFGTGQLIKACLDKGVKKLLIGIGGSATNDGGAGFIQALGGRLLDENGDDLSYGGGALAKLHTIDLSNLDERLKYVSETSITLKNAFAIADDVLRQGVQSISDLILLPGLVNLDFADVTSVMKDAGYAHMGMGSATGKDKATVAADMAISSPLLETSIDGAKGLIINITASADVSLDDIDAASTMIKDKVSEDANIIWGAVIDDKMEDAISVTVIATGFNADSQVAQKKIEEGFLTDDKKSSATSASKSKKDVTDDDDDDTFYDIMSIFNK